MPDENLAETLNNLRQVVSSFEKQIASGPVSSPQAVENIRARITTLFDLTEATRPQQLLERIIEQLTSNIVHVTHPRYFGLFNPSVPPITVVADTLVALFNPQLAAWEHAPAAQELERLVLKTLGQLIALDLDTSLAHFTSGGAESNTTATLTALVASFPSLPDVGLRALPTQPTLYLSGQAHDTFVKSAMSCGLGRHAIRKIPVDKDFRMNVLALREQIRTDRFHGEQPFLVVASAGTTATGTIDPLSEISAVAKSENLWMHVDAAWGGGALLSPTLRKHLNGIELADSVTWDAHKWLSVPMSAGMFFSRHPDALRRAFNTKTAYMPTSHKGADDPYTASLQWSRRFIGLKVFMALAETGLSGYATRIDHQASIGNYLRKRLTNTGWLLRNQTPLPLICFTHPLIEGGITTASSVAEQVVESGEAWISTVSFPNGKQLLRACICNYRTTTEDIDRAVDAFNSVLSSATT